jgi:HPr kinase/phosphorylase
VLTKMGENLVGEASPLLGHHMEIRGIGIIDIQRLFGIRAIRKRKRIEVEVELVEWDAKLDYERIGIEDKKVNLLGVDINKMAIPISPGKNITVISEVIAMNSLLKLGGLNPAKEFNDRIIKSMVDKEESAELPFEEIE